MDVRFIFREMNELVSARRAGRCSSSPVVDECTRKLTAAMREAVKKLHGRGKLVCSGCGAEVENVRFNLGPSHYTSSLAVHMAVYHRSEIAPEILRMIEALNVDPVDPTPEEMGVPAKNWPVPEPDPPDAA